MKLEEKIGYLQDNYFNEWIKARQICADEISNSQSSFCVCGKLATGFHESTCRKYNNKVNRETVKKLEYLIKKPSKRI